MMQPRAYQEGSLGTLSGPNMSAYQDGTLGTLSGNTIQTVGPASNMRAYNEGSLSGGCGCGGGVSGLGEFNVGNVSVLGVALSALLGGWIGGKVMKKDPAKGRMIGAATLAGLSAVTSAMRKPVETYTMTEEVDAPAPDGTAGFGEYFSSGVGEYFSSGV